MYPPVENIILGVIANGLTAILAQILSKGGNLFIPEDAKKRHSDLQSILVAATEQVSETLEKQEHPAGDEITCLFLNSPEVEAIVRQIYSVKLSLEEKNNGIDLIKDEFLTTFSLYTALDKNILEDSSSILFNTLLAGCEQALNTLIDEGILSAHEAKSNYRYRIIRDEIASIQKNLSFLATAKKATIQDINKFEETYRNQVGDRHSHVIPPNFDVARKIPIDDLYVRPSFVNRSLSKAQGTQQVKMSDFLTGVYRVVLLGNPGGGKSTFSLKICHDLAVRYDERQLAGRLVTPILVILRDYGAEKKAHGFSILQFIESTANSKYQVLPPAGAFEHLLLNGRGFVIFDGLDELLETSYRQEISADVESFCSLYPSVPVLVTSREVGYEQTPLDEKRFDVYGLAPFDNEQVSDYVTKWFNQDGDLTEDQRTQKVNTFLEESEILPDLRSNPLMLALMCNIYRGENYIPQNRPDVYSKCAEMLFERWDKSRGIIMPLPIEAHMKPAMMDLAYWIYANEEFQGGVTERHLTARTTDYLCPRRFEDRDEAEKAAGDFIEFCRGRAWVFTDIGTTKDGERIYQFTHRTFLEYFAAAHLVRTCETTDDLEAILQPRIARQEWDVVAQLAFQIKNKNSEDAGDKLLNFLIRPNASVEMNESWNLISFAARCLQFIVPSPKISRDITNACIKQSLDRIFFMREEKLEYVIEDSNGRRPLALLEQLVSASHENRPVIADTLEKSIVQVINSEDDEYSLIGMEIGFNLSWLIELGEGNVGSQRGLADYWKNISERIFDTCFERISALCPAHYSPCIESYWREKISIIDVINWHGYSSLFFPSQLTLHSGYWNPIADSLLLVLDSENRNSLKQNDIEWILSSLKEVGHFLLNSPRPLAFNLQTEKENQHFFRWVERHPVESSQRSTIEENLTLDPESLFGIFVLVASLLESMSVEPLDHYTQVFARLLSNHPLESLWIILSARFNNTSMKKALLAIDRCGFIPEQKDFIIQWLDREFSLA